MYFLCRFSVESQYCSPSHFWCAIAEVTSRIIRGFGLEGTFQIIQFQPSAMDKGTFYQTRTFKEAAGWEGSMETQANLFIVHTNSSHMLNHLPEKIRLVWAAPWFYWKNWTGKPLQCMTAPGWTAGGHMLKTDLPKHPTAKRDNIYCATITQLHGRAMWSAAFYPVAEIK